MPVIVDTRTEPDLSCADQTNNAYDALSIGQSLEIVADHDPQPLYFMLRAERGEASRGTWWSPGRSSGGPGSAAPTAERPVGRTVGRVIACGGAAARRTRQETR